MASLLTLTGVGRGVDRGVVAWQPWFVERVLSRSFLVLQAAWNGVIKAAFKALVFEVTPCAICAPFAKSCPLCLVIDFDGGGCLDTDPQPQLPVDLVPWNKLFLL